MDSATRRKAMTMYAQSCGVDVEKLEVTENGTYTAPSGKAYSPVIVNVDSGGGGNPNQYAPGMALLNGKYYTENGVLYICTRDTGVPVYQALADLLGLYVEVTS